MFILPPQYFRINSITVDIHTGEKMVKTCRDNPHVNNFKIYVKISAYRTKVLEDLREMERQPRKLEQTRKCRLIPERGGAGGSKDCNNCLLYTSRCV